MTAPLPRPGARSRGRLGKMLGRGLAAGIAGTAAEVVATRIEDRLRGHRSILDPGLMAGRLSRTRLHRPLSPGGRPWIAAAMRWTYGPSWGLLLGVLLGDRRRVRWPLWGLGLGSAILGFEVLSLPLSGATPPLRDWGLRPLVEDSLNTALYGVAAAGVWRLLAAKEETR